MGKSKTEENKVIVAQNKNFMIFILERYEAGIVLKGNEVKSLRAQG